MLAEIRAEVIKLAAEMAQGDGIPSEYDEDHPPRKTRSYWLYQLEKAHNSNKAKAMRLKAIFDKLSALERPAVETKVAQVEGPGDNARKAGDSDSGCNAGSTPALGSTWEPSPSTLGACKHCGLSWYLHIAEDSSGRKDVCAPMQR